MVDCSPYDVAWTMSGCKVLHLHDWQYFLSPTQSLRLITDENMRNSITVPRQNHEGLFIEMITVLIWFPVDHLSTILKGRQAQSPMHRIPTSRTFNSFRASKSTFLSSKSRLYYIAASRVDCVGRTTG
jgi:hypothetical protein